MKFLNLNGNGPTQVTYSFIFFAMSAIAKLFGAAYMYCYFWVSTLSKKENFVQYMNWWISYLCTYRNVVYGSNV